MLPAQLSVSSQDDPTISSIDKSPLERWINVKTAYRTHYNQKNVGGMAAMLKKSGLKLEGRHHSGIDDCENIARIVKKMREDGWKPHF